MDVLREGQKKADKLVPARKKEKERKNRKRKKSENSGKNKGEIMQYLKRADVKEASSRDNKCMIASGKCIEHDSSVVRTLAMKTKSVVSRNGEVNWRKCDFVSLVCPVAQQLKMTGVLAPNTALSPDECEGTNHRGRKFPRSEDQSASSRDLSEEIVHTT